MPKLRPLSRRDVLTILHNNGFIEAGGTRHIKLRKILPDGSVLTTYVSRGSNEIPVKIIKYIIKQTGKPRGEFE